MRMFKNIAWIFVILGIAVVLITPKGYAQPAFNSDGNPGDNAAGDIFTAESSSVTLEYTDINNNPKPATRPADSITFTVSPEYGFSMLGAVADQLSLTPGTHVTHESYAVTNEGDADDTYRIESFYTLNNGANNWTVEVWSTEASVVIATLTPSTVSTYNAYVPDDDDTIVHYEVDIPSAEADAPDGSYIEVYTTFETSSRPVGTYEGGNLYQYGGTSEAFDDFIDQIASPTMTITRETVVDAPTDYFNNGGGAHDPVPGAEITFVMYYENKGSADAGNVVIIDKVPTIEAPSTADAAGTDLGHINAGQEDRGPVSLTHDGGGAGGHGTGTDWWVYYTTEATPLTTFDAAGWVLIGILTTGAEEFPPTGFFTSADDAYDAIWVKWQKGTVASGESATLVWGATVR